MQENKCDKTLRPVARFGVLISVVGVLITEVWQVLHADISLAFYIVEFNMYYTCIETVKFAGSAKFLSG